MRLTCVVLGIAVGLAAALGLLAALEMGAAESVSAAPSADIRYVYREGGVDAGDCSDAQNPCRTVQYAVSQAASGSVIQVADGDVSPAVYTGPFAITRSLTLQGGWHVDESFGFLRWRRISPCEAERVVLTVRGTDRVISITGAISPVIDCFTILGGDAA
ncbi:MAG: hypothetical protein GX601_02105, partial [Anaerolineales bacterium]|nr:hypothetical protein [Anaerolineales bacterium]